MKMFFLVILCSLACAAAQAAEAPSTRLTVENAPKSNSNYVICSNDLLHITVFQEDDLERKMRISKDGTINYPLIGVITLGGKTVAEATSYIQDLLEKDYLVNPHVTISIEEYSKRRFSVLGQVQKPGYYEIPNEETVDLLQAIAMAGGYTRIADPGRITVKRVTETGDKIFRLNAKEMAKKADKSFEILSNDTITVGESIF
ncbi:MAG: polysaccharide biosynthesis/export family protein [bacterium]